MSPELVSILALVAMFAVATVLPVNMGLLALVGAFVVGRWVADLEDADILGGFPGSLFVTLVGITYLFAIAQRNGTIDWLVRSAVRAVRGRVWLIPWVMVAVAAALTAVGAVSPAAVAILAPVALGFAAQYGISPLPAPAVRRGRRRPRAGRHLAAARRPRLALTPVPWRYVPWPDPSTVSSSSTSPAPWPGRTRA
jgi:di/tricarboxylate transporter